MAKYNKQRNVIKLVRKSNELVEARYKFDIWETRIFTKMLTMIHKDDNDFQNYRIYLKDVVHDFDLESNNDAYERLRAGGLKLMTKIVKVIRNTDEGTMELQTPIVVGVENLVNRKGKGDEGRFINVSFHPGMKPFLLSLKSHFTTYDIRNILKLPSSYSIRIYELLKQYQKIGRRKFLLEELKEVIGVKEEIIVNGKKQYKDSYPKFGNFKQRVLLKAQKDLKKFTDISFEFDQLKRGRSVYALQFYIYPNNNVNNTNIQDIETIQVEDTEVDEIYELVKEWLGKSTVRQWISKYPIEQVQRGVNYTLQQIKAGQPIANIGGYLQKMVRSADFVDTKTIKSKQMESKKEKLNQQKALKLQTEKALKMLQLEYLEKEDILINEIKANHADVDQQIIGVLQYSRFAKYDTGLSLAENLKNPMTKAAYRNAIIKQFEGHFIDIKTTYEPRILALKNQLLSM